MLRFAHLAPLAALTALLVNSVAVAQRPPTPSLAPRVGALSGEVELSLPQTHAPSLDEELSSGARLRVGSSGSATVLVGTAHLLAGNNTELYAPPAAPALPGTLPPPPVSLSHGSLTVRIEGARTVAVGTPGATVLVDHGVVRIEVDAGRGTLVEGLEGRARVVLAGRTVAVPSGHGLRVSAARLPTPLRALPAVPSLAQPLPEARLSSGDPEEFAVELSVPPSVLPPWHLHTVLARDAQAPSVLEDRNTDTTGHLTLHNLVPGSYRLSVSVVDGEGFESPPMHASFSLVTPRVVDASEGRRGGIEVPAGHFCSLDGGVFERAGTVLTMAPARAHELRCATRADGASATRVPIAAERLGRVTAAVRVSGGEWDPEGGMRAISLALTDAAGLPVSYATIRVETNQGVSVDVPREGNRRGTYVGSFSWRRGVPNVHLTFVLNNAERVSYSMGPERP